MPLCTSNPPAFDHPQAGVVRVSTTLISQPSAKVAGSTGCSADPVRTQEFGSRRARPRSRRAMNPGPGRKFGGTGQRGDRADEYPRSALIGPVPCSAKRVGNRLAAANQRHTTRMEHSARQFGGRPCHRPQAPQSIAVTPQTRARPGTGWAAIRCMALVGGGHSRPGPRCRRARRPRRTAARVRAGRRPTRPVPHATRSASGPSTPGQPCSAVLSRSSESGERAGAVHHPR